MYLIYFKSLTRIFVYAKIIISDNEYELCLISVIIVGILQQGGIRYLV